MAKTCRVRAVFATQDQAVMLNFMGRADGVILSLGFRNARRIRNKASAGRPDRAMPTGRLSSPQRNRVPAILRRQNQLGRRRGIRLGRTTGLELAENAAGLGPGNFDHRRRRLRARSGDSRLPGRAISRLASRAPCTGLGAHRRLQAVRSHEGPAARRRPLTAQRRCDAPGAARCRTPGARATRRAPRHPPGAR